jgi:hypothetical protein
MATGMIFYHVEFALYFFNEMNEELNFNFERSEFNGISKGADDHARFMSHIMANVAIVGCLASSHNNISSGVIKKGRET